MAFVIISKGIPVLYSSWQEWREEFLNQIDEEQFPALPSVDLGEFCAMCWGRGTIYEVLLGNDWIGTECENCSGIGRIWK